MVEAGPPETLLVGNSLELKGITCEAYSSTKEAVLKVTKTLNVNVRPEDVEISHRIQRKRSETIIVKFDSHKKTLFQNSFHFTILLFAFKLILLASFQVKYSFDF